MPIITNKNNNEEVEEWLKAIGQAIIDRSKDISNDMKNVRSISIYSTITPNEILNFDITKNYMVEFKNEE